MVKINPSLMFSGACGNAFRRYASLFGGEIVYMLTYAESPLAREVPPDWRDKVWFARLRAGGLDLTGGDVLPRDYETPRGFSMVLGVANADEADRVFAGLADGGEVIMPLQATHWSPRYGLVRDPFGIRWEINCDAEPSSTRPDSLSEVREAKTSSSSHTSCGTKATEALQRQEARSA
ncbi:MAG TPA: VOC family protein [Vicinamibacterales bacterium]|nr:VOC family protein [Vicinamibacterales bacterium]